MRDIAAILSALAGVSIAPVALVHGTDLGALCAGVAALFAFLAIGD